MADETPKDRVKRFNEKFGKDYERRAEKVKGVVMTPEAARFLLAAISLAMLVVAKDKAGTKDAIRALLACAEKLGLGTKEELIAGLNVMGDGRFFLPKDIGSLLKALCEIGGVGPAIFAVNDDGTIGDEGVEHFEVTVNRPS